MSKQLPERPNLDHLREQAKDLLRAYRRGDEQVLTSLLPHLAGRPAALHDAQSALARAYGFASWRELVDHVETVRAREGITPEVVKRYVDLALSDNIASLRRILGLYPGLPSHNPACALVSAEEAYVRSWLTPERVQVKLGPNDWLPIEYVAFSRIHRLDQGRYDSQLACARLVLDNGADPNTFHLWEDGDARLPVLYGASGASGHLGITRLLLEHGAHPDDGESVYHSAQFDRREILEALLEYGADISGKDAHVKHQPAAHKWNNTPIFFLMGHRPTDPGMAEAARGIEWLLEHGADPNIPCYEPQETALHAAARCGWGKDMISLLLRHGADPAAQRRDGRTPYALAAMTGNKAAAEALQNAGAPTEMSTEDAFVASCALGDMARARDEARILPRLSAEQKGVFVKLAEYGVIRGVEAMLAAGWDVATPGECGATALHFACFCGHADVARILLDNGAPIDVRDGQFHATPVGWALHGLRHHRSPSGDYVGILEALLTAGASREEIREALDHEDAPADVVEAMSKTLGEA